MNKLTELYKEFRRYGRILEDNEWLNQGIFFRRMVIEYGDYLYDIYLKGGEVEEISIYHDYNF